MPPSVEGTSHPAAPDSEAPPGSHPPDWVEVYTGRGAALRAVEEDLKSRDITVVRTPYAVGAAFEVGIFGTDEGSTYILSVPPDEYEARREEVDSAVAECGGLGTGDLAAQEEAEEDYDVRACPTCSRFFHDTYLACPGDGTALVPAVECFAEGQLEPDRVVVWNGEPAAAEAVAERMRTAGFNVQVKSPSGWTTSLVALAWAELIDRTAEAEALLRNGADASV